MRSPSRLGVIASLGLALSLACNLSALGQTITATPNLTPRLDPPLVNTVSPQPSPTPPSTNTTFPTATLDPLATPVSVDPCALITQDNAASAIGEPVQAGIVAGGGCVYVDSDRGQYFLSAYAIPSTNTPTLIEGRVYLLVAYGAQVSQPQLANLQALGVQGNAAGVIESLLSLTKTTATFSAQSIDGLGDGAIWVSKLNGAVRQSFLLVARGDALVGLDLIVTYARDESSVRDSAIAALRQMLDRLPPRFIVSFPARVPTPLPTLATSQPNPTLSPTRSLTLTDRSPTATPSVGSPTVPAPPTLKPPAFSIPIVSSNQVTYGGSCGLSLVSFTVTVADPSQVSPITKASVFVRVNDPATGQVTEFTELPLRPDRNDVWLAILNVETQLPGHEKFTNAALEYYFSATNTNAASAESPRYGVQSNRLTLTACETPTP